MWEAACRAGTTTLFYNGDDIGRADEIAWMDDDPDFRHRAVGLKKPNPYGLHDMVGNVYEWTEDRWRVTYEGAPENGFAAVGGDPLYNCGPWLRGELVDLIFMWFGCAQKSDPDDEEIEPIEPQERIRAYGLSAVRERSVVIERAVRMERDGRPRTILPGGDGLDPPSGVPEMEDPNEPLRSVDTFLRMDPSRGLSQFPDANRDLASPGAVRLGTPDLTTGLESTPSHGSGSTPSHGEGRSDNEREAGVSDSELDGLDPEDPINNVTLGLPSVSFDCIDRDIEFTESQIYDQDSLDATEALMPAVRDRLQYLVENRLLQRLLQDGELALEVQRGSSGRPEYVGVVQRHVLEHEFVAVRLCSINAPWDRYGMLSSTRSARLGFRVVWA